MIRLGKKFPKYKWNKNYGYGTFQHLNALKKFGVSEPDQLPDDKKKEFYNYVDANWSGDKESDSD